MRKAKPPATEPDTAPRGRGRPSAYTKALADTILRRMAEGETLTAICRDEAVPARGTVWAWQQAHPEFQDAYSHARKEQAQTWADATIDLADSASAEDWQVKRLQISSRQWFAARQYPELFGDRIAHQQLGKNGQPVDPTMSEARMWQTLFKQLPTELVRQIADHLENEGATDAE